MEISERVFELIDAAIAENRQPTGLLFHGTVEPITGPSLTAGADGVFWTTTNPRIAQQYMPASGSSQLFGAINTFERDRPVKPFAASPWFVFSKSVSGHTDADFDVEMDSHGSLRSWRIPDGWLTYSEAEMALEKRLGYPAGQHHWVKIRRDGDQEEFMPASYQMPGLLYVTLAEGLKFKDLRRSHEGDLMDREDHSYKQFAEADVEGRDGVLINDFAQTDRFGNIGHLSYGILPNRLAGLEWVVIPASRYELCSVDDLATMPVEILTWHQDFPNLAATTPKC